VDLLDVNNHALITPIKDLSPEDKQEVQVAQAGAKALWSISQSKKNRDEMRKAGCVRLLARLLKSVHGDVVVPIMGTLQQCASEVTCHSVMSVSLYLFISKLLRQIRSNLIFLMTVPVFRQVLPKGPNSVEVFITNNKNRYSFLNAIFENTQGNGQFL